MTDWAELVRRQLERYRERESGIAGTEDPDERQRLLTRLGNAAAGAGLALLMAGDREESAGWLVRAAELYRESWDDAPPGSWGRPIGALKALVLAGDESGAAAAALWALEAGAATAGSPIGRYAGALALLVLGRDEEARHVAATIRDRDDFPPAVADALATIAAGDRAGYLVAAEDVLDSFERRDAYLEDVPAADTVLVLQALAAPRDLTVDLPPSPLLP